MDEGYFVPNSDSSMTACFRGDSLPFPVTTRKGKYFASDIPIWVDAYKRLLEIASGPIDYDVSVIELESDMTKACLTFIYETDSDDLEELFELYDREVGKHGISVYYKRQR